VLIRGKYPAELRQCEQCSFVFVPNPVWLAEAYAEPINISDTGYVARNLWARDKTQHLIEKALNPNGVFLDYAGGYGLFVRLMRDLGYDFRWYDLYCQNLFCRGFESAAPLQGPFEAVTAFEVFEHLTDPREEVRKLSDLSSCIVFSTRLLPEPAPQPEDWWYFGLEHGQHVAFYTRKSLEALGRLYGYDMITNGEDLHAFSRQPFPAEWLIHLPNRWERWWARLRGQAGRPSLVWADHEFVTQMQRHP
jgi:hypothetical protein